VKAGRDAGRSLFQYLVDNGVICDWREPDVIRMAPVALYNRFADCIGFATHVRAWATR
jgi:kynureninase